MLIMILIVAFILFILVVWALLVGTGATPSPRGRGKCGPHCAAKDPVSDPAYNARQVVENSLLLEDHLTDEKKVCNDCICKHFLLVHGYSAEALSLAGSRIKEYPHLRELPTFYDGLYQKWRSNNNTLANTEEMRLNIATELRDMRKKLMSTYLM